MGTFELDLVNFQSIGKANLEFIPGINLIVGQSNSGKTAILRAIKTLLTNPARAKHFIKKNTNEAVVTIDTGDNNFIWYRSEKGGSKYCVNNEEYSKLGTKGLFEILERNGFVQDDRGNVMNIEGEWDLPFPFDKSPAELFRLFENIFCVSDSAVILKSYKDEEASLVKEKAQLKDSRERFQVKLKALDDLEKEVDLDNISKKLEEFTAHAKELSDSYVDIKVAEKDSEISNITLDDKLPPEEYSLQILLDIIIDYKFLGDTVKKAKFVKSLPATLEVPNTLEGYISTQNDFKLAEKAARLLRIDLSKEYHATEDYSDLYKNMVVDCSYIEKALEISEHFDLSKECDIFSSLHDYEQMLQDFKQTAKCFKQIKAIKERYEALEKNLKVIQEQLGEFTVCPLCGHELEGDNCSC